jgi:hypothetical protein
VFSLWRVLVVVLIPSLASTERVENAGTMPVEVAAEEDR